jgi:hypothetical protein
MPRCHELRACKIILSSWSKQVKYHAPPDCPLFTSVLLGKHLSWPCILVQTSSKRERFLWIQLAQLDYKLAADLFRATGSVNPLGFVDNTLVIGVLCIFALEGHVTAGLQKLLLQQFGRHPHCQVLSWLGKTFKRGTGRCMDMLRFVETHSCSLCGFTAY